ncbi:DUF2207 domain-containing protein [Candidatus Peregrinibacteria bacterium]|jgi:uncharacterized membrane protein|nr:DUF2207 domain-containing protein [Candidatus Peregrinibacteria bacterium]MBT7484603.1 DUF2207 domain-containing protein [Candidatus Peregrinibacteria bacterium]MBT7702703.1 DUF2207 domain-containing protein [Candidatus Peregrinibacteria bacterium]
MKFIHFKSVTLGVVFFCTLFPSLALAEYVDYFHSNIEIFENSTIHVTETIVYDFETEEHRGIFRDILETFDDNTKIISVTDENGEPYPYEATDGDKYTSLRIGDPNIYITGEHTYVITYEIEQEISFFEEHDELYWNVNGTAWEVPFNEVSATITYPQKLTSEDIMTTCYTGFYGLSESDCSYSLGSQADQTQIHFEATRALETDGFNSENLTIVAGFPKGILKEPLFWNKRWPGWHVPTWQDRLADEWYILIGALIFAAFSYKIWRQNGDDPVPKTPVVAQYKSPENFTAAEMIVLTKGSLDARALTATLFELGTKGLLSIKEEDKKLRLIKKSDPKKGQLDSFQQYVFDKLFKTRDTRTLDELKHKFSDYTSHQNKILKKLKKDGYYDTLPFNGYTVLLAFIFMGLAGASVPLYLAFDYAGYATAISAAITLLFAFFMTKKSQKGVELVQAIKGFKLFLEVTEKDRLKFHNPPAQTLELFQTMLPFAIALNVEKDWLGSFQGLLTEELESNSDYWLNFTNISANALTNSIAGSVNSMDRMTKLAMASKPSSSGSGHSSSGFSSGSSGGGGFSGGGGGGGGGGSW